MKIIKVHNYHMIVKDKVTAYFLDPQQPTKMVVWLTGGESAYLNFPDEKSAIENFNAFDAIMSEP
jgi:hypothetical protein